MSAEILIPPTVSALLARLNAAGFAAYAVGGCIRDSLLGLEPQDWDVCTAARPEQTAACFSDCRTLLTGAAYGTVTVLWGAARTPFEITTFRAERGYSDRRHPDRVEFLSELRGDLARRDFTVNAMAADATGLVYDPFGGQNDLQNRVLRCVGVPAERFSEDALRMLRGLRFAARLGLSIEPETASALHACRSLLKNVATERIRKELEGLLCGTDAPALLREFADVLCVPIPELAPCIGFRQFNYHHRYDVWEHTLHALAASEPDEALRLAVLLHDVGKPAVFSFDKQLVGHFYGHARVSAAMAERILRRLRFDGKTVSRVSALIAAHDLELAGLTERRMRRLLHRLGERNVRTLLRLRRADRLGKGTERPEDVQADTAAAEELLRRLCAEDACCTLRQLALSGDDLLALGLPAGKRVGAVLRAALTTVLDGNIQNERDALMRFAQNYIRNSIQD